MQFKSRHSDHFTRRGVKRKWLNTAVFSYFCEDFSRLKKTQKDVFLWHFVAKILARPFGCRPRGTSRGFSGRAARAFSIWRLRVSWGAFFAPFWRRAGETPVKLGEKPGEGRFTWALPGFGPIFLQGGQKSLRLCGKPGGGWRKIPARGGRGGRFQGRGHVSSSWGFNFFPQEVLRMCGGSFNRGRV